MCREEIKRILETAMLELLYASVNSNEHPYELIDEHVENTLDELEEEFAPNKD